MDVLNGKLLGTSLISSKRVPVMSLSGSFTVSFVMFPQFDHNVLGGTFRMSPSFQLQ